MARKATTLYVMLILLLTLVGIGAEARRASRPSYYFWTSKGSIIKIKPKYGRQLMPDRPIEKTSGNKLLLFSNSPETLSEEELPALLYRAEARGRFRVLLHHQNKLGRNARINLVFTNKSPRRKILKVGKSSNCRIDGNGTPRYSTETISSDPAIAGRNAFIRWLTEEAGQYGETDLPPGEKRVLSFPFRNNATLSSMTDFRVCYDDGKDADALVEVCATGVGVDAERLDLSKMRSVPDPVSMSGDSSRIRGMFDYTELRACFTYRLSEVSYSEIGSAVDGMYSSCNPGEYRESLFSKELYMQKNSGNFGICYEITLRIINDLDADANAVVMASAAGGRSLVILKELEGAGGRSGSENGDIYFADTVMSSSYGMHDAWIFDIVKIEKGGVAEKRYMYTLPCGCNGPVRFYAIASSRLNDIMITSQK